MYTLNPNMSYIRFEIRRSAASARDIQHAARELLDNPTNLLSPSYYTCNHFHEFTGTGHASSLLIDVLGRAFCEHRGINTPHSAFINHLIEHETYRHMPHMFRYSENYYNAFLQLRTEWLWYVINTVELNL